MFAPAVFSGTLEPLTSVLREVCRDEEVRGEIESELSLIVNAAIQRYSERMADTESVAASIETVRGALNIGLERATAVLGCDAVEILRVLRLQPLYRLGLSELKAFRKRVRDYVTAGQVPDGPGIRLLAEGALSGDLPRYPATLQNDGSIESAARDDAQYRPYFSSAELARAESAIVGRAG